MSGRKVSAEDDHDRSAFERRRRKTRHPLKDAPPESVWSVRSALAAMSRQKVVDLALLRSIVEQEAAAASVKPYHPMN
jgi:hypothetical protein